jgi:hypothetical protein
VTAGPLTQGSPPAETHQTWRQSGRYQTTTGIPLAPLETPSAWAPSGIVIQEASPSERQLGSQTHFPSLIRKTLAVHSTQPFRRLRPGGTETHWKSLKVVATWSPGRLRLGRPHPQSRSGAAATTTAQAAAMPGPPWFELSSLALQTPALTPAALPGCPLIEQAATSHRQACSSLRSGYLMRSVLPRQPSCPPRCQN